MCILWKKKNFAMCLICLGRILQMYYNYNHKLSAQTFCWIWLSFNSPLVIMMAIISSVVSDLLLFTDVMIIGWCRARIFLKYCICLRNEPHNHLEKNVTLQNSMLHFMYLMWDITKKGNLYKDDWKINLQTRDFLLCIGFL